MVGPLNLLGTGERIDLTYIHEHPKPDQSEIKQILIREANVGIII